MGGIALEFTAPDLAAAERKLQALLGAALDLSPLMRQLATYLGSSTRERFETLKGPDDKAWIESIRAKLSGGDTLTDHGILRTRIVEAADANSATVGTNDIRAASLHFGLNKAEPIKAHTRTITQAFGRKLAAPVTVSVPAHSRNPNIPARPIVGASSEDLVEIREIITDYMAEAFA